MWSPSTSPTFTTTTLLQATITLPLDHGSSFLPSLQTYHLAPCLCRVHSLYGSQAIFINHKSDLHHVVISSMALCYTCNKFHGLKIQQCLAPTYLSNLILYHFPLYSLCSSHNGLLGIPQNIPSCYSLWAFISIAPSI